MRPLFRALRAVAALSGATVLLLPAFTTPAGAEDQTVSVGGNGNTFSPATVTVKPGDTVTWQYAGGSGHNVTATSNNWEKADPVGPPALLNFTTDYLFENPGTYRYVCTTYDGMRGVVVVEGAAKPKPTVTKPTTRPTPRPTRTPTATAAPSGSATPSATPSASASGAGTARPPAPSGSIAPPSATTAAPLPSIAPSGRPAASGTPFLGTGGLTPHPATGRGKGLPVMLALLLIGGVGSAELRALLAHAPR